ncbi:MAG: MATE family efflux transporter, partial [Selenomonas sp.]|uniref:MATE family efflux transporter n=1 Tax=Selenomonas sp. TaxID=2053611 RepID=UPI0025E1F1D8
MKGKERMKWLGEAPISQALWKLGLPTMIGMLVASLYNVVDAFWVGMLGTVPLAAVTVVFPLTMVGMGVGMMFGTGANSSIARLLGEKNIQRARDYSATAVYSGVIFMTLLTGLLLWKIDAVLWALGATPESFVMAKSYGEIFIVGLIINVFTMTMNNIIVAEGNPAQSMRAMLVAGVSNMILDPIFIFGFAGGVEGAAWATLAARSLAAIIYLRYLFSGAAMVSVSPWHFTLSGEIYRNILKIGIPFLGFQLLSGAAVGVTNAAAAAYGTAALAAMGVVTRITSVASNVLIGFIKGFAPLAGFNYGAGNLVRVWQATHKAMWWSTLALFGFAAICLLFDYDIMTAFVPESVEAITIGQRGISYAVIALTTFGVQAVINNYFLAVGKAKQGFVLSVFFQGLLYIPVLLIMKSIYG